MRTRWVPGSAALLATGVVALVCGFSVSPLTQDVSLEQAFRVPSDFGERLVVSVLMLVVAAVGMTAGSVALLHLMPARSRLTRVAITTYAVGSAGLLLFAAGLGYTRSLLDERGVLHVDAIERLREQQALQVVLVVWLIVFMTGLVLVAIGLARNPDVPRWVPILIGVFVVSQPLPLPGGHACSVAQFVVLALALSQAAVVSTRHADLPVEPRPVRGPSWAGRTAL